MIGVLVAMAAALVRPADAFVLAFFVLGPLHYLTELSWLRDRGLFSADPQATGIFAGLALVGTVAALVPPTLTSQAVAVGVVLGAVIAAAWAIGRARHTLVVAALGAAVGTGLMWSPAAPQLFEVFGVWLPTFVHVVVLNVAFMLHGVLTRRARADLVALLAFGLAFGVLCVAPAAPAPPAGAFDDAIGFLHTRLVRLGLDGDTTTRLLAFVYVHHFLNWFEKTERIGWLRMPRARLFAVGSIWLALVALAAVDLRWALAAGLLPNLAHVLCELPLNLRTLSSLRGIANA